jgi:AraC-like DNA-binding protein
MKLNALDIVFIVLFFQMLTLFPYLVFKRSSRSLSNQLLAIFLLAKAICLSNFMSFRLREFFYLYFPHTFYFGTSFAILWGPLLYLYIKSLIISGYRLKIHDAIHAIPFLLHFLLLTTTYHIYSADTKREILMNGGLFGREIWLNFFTGLYIHILFYSIASFRLIIKFQRNIKEHYSVSDSVILSWVKFLLIGFMINWMCDVFYHMSDKSGSLSSVALVISRASKFIFINTMIYKGISHSEIFLGESSRGIRKQSLSKQSKATYLQKLLNCMEKDKPYFNPKLTLEELANIAHIPQRSLTVVLNEELNQNFHDFINTYRIKESARMLSSRNHRFNTVLEVLYEVGFNSKSSFNTAFKKHMGMTPTQFKRLQIVQRSFHKE